MQQEMPVPVYARPPRVAFHISGVSGDEGVSALPAQPKIMSRSHWRYAFMNRQQSGLVELRRPNMQCCFSPVVVPFGQIQKFTAPHAGSEQKDDGQACEFRAERR